MLPAELLEAIAVEIKDIPTLRILSRSCRSLRDPAQRILFRSISLDGTLSTPKFLTLLEDSPRIGTYVSNVVLTVQILRKSRCVPLADEDDFLVALFIFLKKLPLRDVYVSGFQLSATSIRRLLQCAPRMSFSTTWIDNDGDGASFEDVPTAKSLSLRRGTDHITKLLGAQPQIISGLCELMINIDRYNVLFIPPILSPSATTLSRIWLDDSGSIFNVKFETPFTLPACLPVLGTAELGICSPAYHPAWLQPVLTQLLDPDVTPSLTVLNLTYYYVYLRTSSSTDAGLPITLRIELCLSEGYVHLLRRRIPHGRLVFTGWAKRTTSVCPWPWMQEMARKDFSVQ
ncbi:hypothetical protein C8F01DRAFT_1130036 [Mycena amicta]|nr:hypothetical protein C8F01DRAFT_1130036 [Mycena amicta]